MLKIIQKDFHESVKSGYLVNQNVLKKILDKAPSGATDEAIFNMLEDMIDECARKIKKMMGRGRRNMDYDLYGTKIFEQQVYNRYISRYKLDEHRRIEYKTRFETESDGRMVSGNKLTFPL